MFPLCRSRRWRLACLAATLTVPWATTTAAGQEAGAPPERPVTLEAALAQARVGNADLRMAGARERGARAEVGRARAALLPSLGLTSGWTRSVDPVAVFGTKLRQGRFAEPDFAVDALNDPALIDDWASRVSASWDLVAPSRWAARASAAHRAEAVAWAGSRTREATDYRTRVLYYEAVRAAERRAAARSALEAAAAVVDQFDRRMEEGLLTRAELLQARADREAARATLAAARQQVREAGVALAVHLGWSPDTLPTPVDGLAEPGPPATASVAGVEGRADLRAAAAGVRAAEERVASARLEFLPSLGTFAAWSSHGTDPLDGSGTDWTVGVGLRWSLFAGLGRKAELEHARAGLAEARIRQQAAVRDARGEVLAARDGVESAREGLAAARASRRAAVAGRDLMRRRFDEGLATAAELLQAEARARAAEAGAVDALARYHIARARLQFASAEPGEEGVR